MLFFKSLTEVFLRILIFSLLILILNEPIYSLESQSLSKQDIKLSKASKDYANKFCNGIGFGLSKESALNFAINENNKLYNKIKDYKEFNSSDFSRSVSSNVIEKCGYPIGLSGEEGEMEFNRYFIEFNNKIVSGLDRN